MPNGVPEGRGLQYTPCWRPRAASACLRSAADGDETRI